ncbi:hypothetical protein BJ170DRAFT_585791 [Xylariales sp. AK1849]|nr:hypothetical protein BJ170DRAFT_585791 [Xylariales sp. AK1849]
MDLDIDMDVDLVPDEPITAQAQDTPSPGEVIDTDTQDHQPDSKALVPNKIYVQGLDVLNPEEVKNFIAEHFPDGRFERIEWIDDSSANLIFPSEAMAQDALVALSSLEIGDVTALPLLELLPARKYSKRPDVNLQIRIAVAGDKKQAGAAQRSRFYLLNPEYDPETRKRYRDRDGEGDRRHRGARRSREDEPQDHFDVNLYDDDTAALASRNSELRTRRRRSYSPGHDRERRSSHRDGNRSKELFPDRSGGRNGTRRDRSASPLRDRDGDLGMDETPPSDGSVERNRRGARAIKERLTLSNRSKELFPSKATSSGSNRLEDADETSSYLSRGRLADRITEPAETSGFSIRGAAKQRGADNQGFAIKGGANKSARELFPDKFGSNAGKELFADRLDGRSRQRQKAGDLFD